MNFVPNKVVRDEFPDLWTGGGAWLRRSLDCFRVAAIAQGHDPENVHRTLAADLRLIADQLDPAAGAPNGRLLTAREVAGILGTTPDWVRARARDWPFARRIGRWWRFEAEGVRLWPWERRRAAEVPNVLEMAWYALLGSTVARSPRSRFEDVKRGLMTRDEIRRSQGFPALSERTGA